MRKMHKSSKDKPSENIFPPSKISDLLSKDGDQSGPRTYLMSHLLAAGFRGSEYQLLILLLKLTTLLVEKPQYNFEASVEVKDAGNLDDIAIVLKKGEVPTSIDTYQVKYYNHPITVYDFFNASNTKTNTNPDLDADADADADTETDDNTESASSKSKRTKNEKMHIGKFFDGWLTWINKYPALPENDLQSIVYSNTVLDELLNSCIQNEVFVPDFIAHNTPVYIGLNKKVRAHIPQNFLTHIQETKVSDYYSKKTWKAIQEKGYINEGGDLTDQCTPAVLNFKLGLSQSQCPPNVSVETVEMKLKELYDKYHKNQIDMWSHLYEQAWNYIHASGKYTELAKKNIAAKEDLFRRFLHSFRFTVQQDNLLDCETNILKNLVKLGEQQPEQIFLCLYYAIREWFRREEHQGQVPILTNVIMHSLISDSKIRYQDVHWLRGRSQAVLFHIAYSYDGCIVARPELDELLEALKVPGLILITGEKGMGKSGLIKQALTQIYSPEQYLLFSAADLMQEREIREKLTQVLEKVPVIDIVVIDAAEVLLQFPEVIIQNLLDSVLRNTNSVVLTLTPEAVHSNLFKNYTRKIAINEEQ